LENADDKSEGEEDNSGLPSWLFTLFVMGFSLIFVGIIIVFAVSLTGGGNASGGVVIFIGPFPIVFGVGPSATWLVLIGIILSAISIAVFVISRRKIFGKS